MGVILYSHHLRQWVVVGEDIGILTMAVLAALVVVAVEVLLVVGEMLLQDKVLLVEMLLEGRTTDLVAVAVLEPLVEVDQGALAVLEELAL
jgi:hypothetical protein